MRVKFLSLVISLIAINLSKSSEFGREIEPDKKTAYLINNKPLATKLNCKKGDSRQFHYNSRNELWGEAGGQIEVDLDVSLYCMGEIDDNYLMPACKYLVELSNVKGIPIAYEKTRSKREADVNNLSQNPLSRSKRGFTDWISNAWEKVKGFFRRVFNMDEPSKQQSRESSDVVVFTAKPKTTTERTYFDPSEVEIFDPSNYQNLYGMPYEFIQLADGSIPEILFAANDTDESIRNFKRHLTEIFSTNLVLTEKTKEEITPLGKHNTRYTHLKTESGTPTSTTPSPVTKTTNQLTVFKKIARDDLLNLTPMDGHKVKGLNNVDHMDLDTVQVQKFHDGDLISAEGELNMAVNEIDSKRRRRRRRNVDEEFRHLAVKTSFTLQLKHRAKRSIDDKDLKQLESEMKFTHDTLPSSTSTETYEMNRLESLREKLSNFEPTLSNLLKETDRQFLTTLLETLELEIKLGKKLFVHLIQKSLSVEKIKNDCLVGDKKPCIVGILLSTTIGGPAYENLLLDLLDTLTSRSDIPNGNSILTQLSVSISSLPAPSNGFLTSILNRATDKTMSSDVSGALANSLSALLVKQNVPGKGRAFFYQALVKWMYQRASQCPKDDDLVFQLVEALGTGGVYEKELIGLAEKCRDVVAYQVHVVKALRHSVTSSLTRDWVSKKLPNSSCEFKTALADGLVSVTMKQRLTEVDAWPSYGFNTIDQGLGLALISNEHRVSCGHKSIVKYFEYKDLPQTERYLNIYRKMQASRGTNNRRRKRQTSNAIWDDENCDDWTNHKENSKEPIEAFEDDGKRYNRWSHCSGKRKLGRDMANAVFDGGMFAGVKYPTNPPEYKVEALMSGEANFLGKDFELGRIGFSLSEKKSKAYVELLGRNLLDLKSQNCSEDEFIYRPAMHIPLYALNIWLVQVSFGIHLGVEGAIQFKCPRSKTSEKYIFEPQSMARVGGEAAGRVLMLRAGINLGGNFNYHLKADLSPYPLACFSAKHGYDPMSVSLESWYQFYKPLSFDDWTKRIRWRPSFLSWDITGSKENDWIKTYCILPDGDVTNATEST